MGRKAFTLVELLIVVGIIAVLVAFLLPMLSNSRAAARQVQCAALLRNWGQAFHEYAAQSDGLLPHSGDRTRNPNALRGLYYAGSPPNESSYLYVLPPLMGDRSWLAYPNGQKPTGGIFQCPLAQQPNDTDFGYSPAYWGYHSFCMNMYLDADKAGMLPGGAPARSSFLPLRRAKTPQLTILLYETTLTPASGYGQNGSPGTVNCMQGLYPNDGPANFSDRHPHQKGKLGGNVVFLDGHVEWRDHVWNPNYPDPTMPPLSDTLWWPY